MKFSYNLSLYWQIGTDILQQQKEEGWGTKVIERLATDLKQEFPNVGGFSSRNLKYMRAFAEAYPDEQIMQRYAAQIPYDVSTIPKPILDRDLHY